MTIAWKKAYVKWGKQEYNAMPKAVSGPCVESNFLSLSLKMVLQHQNAGPGV